VRGSRRLSDVAPSAGQGSHQSPRGHQVSQLAEGAQLVIAPPQRLGNRRGVATVVSPLKPEQLEDVFALYATVFGDEAALGFRSRFKWALVDNGSPDATPKWVLLSEDRVVGFLAAIPQRFRVAGRDAVVHYSCDYMVHPAHRFHGMALMKEYFRACDNCVSLDDVPATIGVLKMMKALPIARVARFGKLLDARALPVQVPRLASVPAAVLAPATWALDLYDRLRAATLPKVVVSPDFDKRFTRFFEQNLPADGVSLVRDHDYLNWRYGTASPQAARVITSVVDDAGELQAYAVSAPLADSPRRVGCIFELHSLPSAPAGALEALLLDAGRRLRAKGCHVVRFHLTPTPNDSIESALRYAQFGRRQAEHVFLVKFRDEALKSHAHELKHWSYSFGDSEASHGVA
jgi:hypothetical protein